MPYSDYKKKLARQREWSKEKVAQGYGKWLYERRKLRFEDAERFRIALEEILTIPPNAGKLDTQPQGIAKRALEESRIAEEKLGRFNGKEG